LIFTILNLIVNKISKILVYLYQISNNYQIKLYECFEDNNKKIYLLIYILLITYEKAAQDY